MSDIQKLFERQIYKKFVKLLKSHDVANIDKQLHAYLTMIYGYNKQSDIKKFRQEFEGIAGFRRFIIHFIKPAKDWRGVNAELNKKIHSYVIENVYEYLHYCTEAEQEMKKNKEVANY